VNYIFYYYVLVENAVQLLQTFILNILR